MTTRRYGLKDEQLEKIKDLLPGSGGYMGTTAKDNRLFIEAVLYRYRTGISWPDLLVRFSDFRVVHTRYTRWAKSGIWEMVFQKLAANGNNEFAMLGSTIVRTHQHSAGAKKTMKKKEENQLEEARGD
jgi:transposase